MNRTSKSWLTALLFTALAVTAAMAHEGHRHSAKGAVKAIAADRLDLETSEGKVETFVVSAATKIRRGDSAAKAEDVVVGERAVVDYEMKGDAKSAIEIRLASAAKPQQAATGTTAGATTNPIVAGLTQVETKKVCMVNDQVFPNDQIPVEVDGRTYYGCCPMCKERLANDAGARTAVDPVSGNKVDKALALIMARPDGTVLYFESAGTLARYRASGP